MPALNDPELAAIDQSQQNHDRDERRGRITRARQAAEALFAPKRMERSLRAGMQPVSAAVRKPRVLSAAAPAPIRHEDIVSPIDPKQSTERTIPVAQFGRIRALVKYGMTARQVARLYGVAVSDVERILADG